jgi:hypothetical protein
MGILSVLDPQVNEVLSLLDFPDCPASSRFGLHNPETKWISLKSITIAAE